MIFLLTTVCALKIYPSTNEVIQWELQDLLGQIDDPIYSIQDEKDRFYIQDPFYKLDQQSTRDNIKSVKPKVTNYGSWLNQFVYLQQTTDAATLYYAEDSQDNLVKAPQFQHPLEVTKSESDIQCYDVDYYDSLFIVDCSNIASTSSYLYIVGQDGTSQQHEQTDSLQGWNSRILRVYNDQSSYVFRGYTYDNQDSEIEIFLLDGKNAPIKTNFQLDGDKFRQLGGFQNTQKFQLIDFKFTPTGRILVLDKSGLLILRMTSQGEWQKISFIPQINPFAFDYIESFDDYGIQLKLLAILRNQQINLYVNDSDEPIQYNTPLSITQLGPKIFLSYQYIILQGTQLYLYKYGQNNLISKQAITTNNIILANPHLPDLIQLDQNSCKRYALTNGLLKSIDSDLQTDLPDSIVVFGESQSNKVIKDFQFQYFVISKDDQALYEIDTWNLFSDPISSPQFFMKLNNFQSGPNINYKQGQDANNIIQMTFFTQFNLSLNALWPKASDIYFHDLIELKDEIIHVIQLKTLVVQFWKCQFNETDNFKSGCGLFNTTVLPSLINANSFQWFLNGDTIHIIFISDLFKVSFWRLVNYQTIRETDITFNSNNQNNQVSQILQISKQLYILQTLAKQIQVFSTDSPYDKLFTINEYEIKKLGFKSTFSPSKIFGSPIYHNHLLFILNPDNFLVIKFQYEEISIIASFPFSGTGDIDVSVNQETMFVIRKATGVQYIHQYNIKNLNLVYLQRQVPIYDYDIQSPVTITAGDDAGYMFVRANQINTQQTPVILVYSPKSLTHDILYRIISYEGKFVNQRPIIMEACGSDPMYLYVNDGEQQFYIALLPYVQAFVQTNFSSNDYMAKSSKQIVSFNQLQSFPFQQELVLVNKMQTITIDITKAAKISLKQGTKQQVSLGSEWYSGQAYTFELSCKTCGKDIFLYEPLQPINVGAFDQLNIQDISFFSQTSTLMTFPTGIQIVDKLNKVLNTVKFAEQNSCEQSTTDPTSKYTITVCNYNGKHHAYLTVCSKECKVLAPIDLIIDAIQKIQITNQNLFYIRSFGKLYIYSFNQTTESWILTLQKVIDPQTISATLIGINDFYVQEQSEGKYLITILDSGFNLFYQQFTYTNEKITYDLSTIINIDQIVKNNNLFVQTSTRFIRVQPLTLEFNANQYVFNTIVIANNVAHYAIQITLTAQFQLVSGLVKFLFNQYGDWTALYKISYSNGYLAIPYTDLTSILIAVYKVPDNYTSFTTPKSIKMIGGVSSPAYNGKVPLLLSYINGYMNRMYSNSFRYSTTEVRITTYDVYDSAQLYTTEKAKVDQNEDVQISAQNHFSQQTLTTKFKNITDNKGSSNIWWIVILTVLFILLVCGITYWYIKRRQKMRQQGSSTGYSLMRE
ncbi:hypothetical protein pb186bvf_009094 [Paramecium bursaria]